MAILETVKIQDGDGDYRIINKTDFKPNEHKVWIPFVKKEVTKKPVQEKENKENKEEIHKDY